MTKLGQNSRICFHNLISKTELDTFEKVYFNIFIEHVLLMKESYFYQILSSVGSSVAAFSFGCLFNTKISKFRDFGKLVQMVLPYRLPPLKNYSLS